ncbi:MAG: hypothetical protein ACMXYG_03460 [Candidatus Woesearchaeota archaeon]
MISTKIRKWGNSYGLLIPKDEFIKLNISENQEVLVNITKKENPLKELFGFNKSHNISKIPSEIIKEARKDMRVD